MTQISSSAAAILACCAANLHKSATRTIGKKACPTVWVNWGAMAAALGLDEKAAFRPTIAALNELKEAGLLADFDEGAGSYGHSTLCFVPQ